MNEGNTKTQEQITLEEKDRRTNLKKFCNSIIQKVNELDNYSRDRAIWELCQNARDLSNEATIKISLDTSRFCFAHKGRPFNEDSLLSLVKQVSSEEKENKDAAGQFGTGFVTTHTFNRCFYLNGSFQTETGKVFDINDFKIDRTEDDINLFIDKMGAQITAVYDLLGKPQACIRDWTEIIYPLNEQSLNKALRAIRVSQKLLPYVLVINDKIKTVILENHIDNKTITYTKRATYQDNGLNVYDISETQACGDSQVIHIYYLEHGDSKIILPLENSRQAKQIDDIAKLFVWFPLLRTEPWGTNFIFHSTFYPLEQRNGIILPCDNVNVQKKYEHNVTMLQEMNHLLYNYLKEHVKDISNSIELAKINFNCHVVEDSMTNDFFNSQQKEWTSVFRTLPLIDTPLGRKSIDEGIKIPNSDICDFFTNEENRAKYFDAFYDYASQAATLPNKNICLRWAEIIHQWGLSDESTYEISLADIAQKVTINNGYKNLHHLLEIIRECKQSKLFETMALIPNREGELRKTTDLREGKNIPEELYTRALSICPIEMKKLVHSDFSDIYSLNEYTRDQVRQAVYNINDKVRTETIRQGKCFSPEHTLALRRFVSIYSTEQPTSNRHQIMQSLSALKNIEYNICYIPKVDEKETDYCLSAFLFLLESELLDISISAENQFDWLKNNRSKLLDFISKIANIKDVEQSSRLLGSNGYAVIPNQSDNLCKLESLRIREDIISDELADMYNKVLKKELRDTWVATDFSQFVSIDKMDRAKEIASIIESTLLEEYESSKQVSQYIIDIIQKIESRTDDTSLWKSWFKRIDEKKADLNWHIVPEASKSSFYRLMKVAQNKELLEELADLSENASLLNKFKELLQIHKQREAEFEFKYKLGRYIEELIRKKLADELSAKLSINPTIKDLQCGQDIVVQFNGRDIFFIECKAKWNFNEPAHMSKLQLQKSCKENGRYALCAVDLTSFNGISETVFPSPSELENHIHIHLDIADKLAGVIEPLLSINEEYEDNRMTISTDYSSNIPKKVFVNNIGFPALIDAILKEISK